MRILLIVLGLATFLVGPTAFFAPHAFYENVPGVAMMGPFNLHFIQDVGLAFTVSGAAMVVGGWQRNRGVALTGAAWPALHGVLHLYIQIQRGLPGDLPMWFDLVAVILPAFLGLYAAAKFDTHDNG